MSTKAGTTPDKAAVNPEDQSGSVPPAANPATGPATTNEKDVGGKRVFLALLIIIPVAVFISLGVLTLVVWNNPDTSVVTTVTTSSDGKVITTTTTYITPTLVYGAADPGLGKVKGFFIGPLIFLMASIIETSLLLIYGAFYIETAESKNSPLGLPQGAVRVFVLIIVILTILTFAFLPAEWGENKAVIFLFGLLSTVVGFYFGSRTDIDRPDAQPSPPTPPTPPTPTTRIETPQATIETGPGAAPPPATPATPAPPATPVTPGTPVEPATPTEGGHDTVGEVFGPAPEGPTSPTDEVQPEPDVPPGPTTGNNP